jgi:hypothetical protein
VIDRIPDKVQKGIGQRFEERLVEFGVLTLHIQHDVFTAIPRQVSHHPRVTIPSGSDLLHARLQNTFLEFAGQQVETLNRIDQRIIRLIAIRLDDLIPGEHEFSDQVHQTIEQVNVDSDKA